MLLLETCCLFTDESKEVVLQAFSTFFWHKQVSLNMLQVPTLHLRYVQAHLQSLGLRFSNKTRPSVCSCTEIYLGLSISLQANNIKCKRICWRKISRLNIWAWESANLLLHLAHVEFEKKLLRWDKLVLKMGTCAVKVWITEPGGEKPLPDFGLEWGVF